VTPVTSDLRTIPLEQGAFRMSAELGDLLTILLQLFAGGSSDAPAS
jgi:hypothetical protein